MVKFLLFKIAPEFKAFPDILRGAWLNYVVAVVLTIFAALLSTINPFIIGEIIDRITGEIPFNLDSEFENLLILLFLLIAARLLSTLANSVSGWMSASKSEIISHQLRDHLTATVFHDRRDHWVIQKQARGEVLSLFNRDIEALWDLFGYVITELISSVVLVVALCLIVIFIAPSIGIVFFIFSTIFVYLYFDNGRRIRAHFASAAPIFDKMIGLTNSFLDGYETIVAFRKQRWARKNISQLSENVTNLANRAHLRSTTFSFATSAASITAVLIIWSLCLPGLLGYPNAPVQVTLGELITILFYFNMIARPLETISGAAKGLSRGSVSLKRLADFVHRIEADTSTALLQSELPDKKHLKNDCNTAPILSLNGICDHVNGKDTPPILERTTFSIHEGEVVGLAGASGSGKTTLLRAIARLIPTEGSPPLLCGQSYTQLSEEDFRAKITYLPQAYTVFPLAILENLFLENGQEGKARAMLSEVALESKIDTLLEQSDLQIAQLSGGEMQRLSLARSLHTNPILLVVDEPTSALDLTNTINVSNFLLKFAKQPRRAVIVASHDPNILSQCSMIHLMEKGKIIQSGTHCDLHRTSAIYRAIIASAQAG